MIDYQLPWTDIKYINHEELEENKPYLVCFEAFAGGEYTWRMIIAYWYLEGSTITIREQDNTPHYFKIHDDGFYVLNDAGAYRDGTIYKINNPSYAASVLPPIVNPDEMITIEKS